MVGTEKGDNKWSTDKAYRSSLHIGACAVLTLVLTLVALFVIVDLGAPKLPDVTTGKTKVTAAPFSVVQNVDVYNPNSYRVSISDLDILVTEQNTGIHGFGELENGGSVKIDAKKSKNVAISFMLADYGEDTLSIAQVCSNEGFRFSAVGNVRVSLWYGSATVAIGEIEYNFVCEDLLG